VKELGTEEVGVEVHHIPHLGMIYQLHKLHLDIHLDLAKQLQKSKKEQEKGKISWKLAC